MDSLVRILCQDNTAATCQRFIQQQPDVINQLAFFLFFPSVFIILFIYVLSDGILSTINPKFKVLLGISIYTFIVLSGWYSLFLWISQFWFIFIILIVGIWFFFRKMFGRGGGSGGGGGRGHMPGLGKSLGLGGSARYLGKKALGKKGIERKISEATEDLRAQANIVRKLSDNPQPGSDIGIAIAHYNSMKNAIMTDIKNFETEVGYLGEKAFADKMWDAINACDKIVREATDDSKRAA